MTVGDLHVDWPDYVSESLTEPSQRSVAAELIELYRNEGLFGKDQLSMSCRCSRECWKEKSAEAADSKVAVAVPWIGPKYRTGGVCAVGMNLNAWQEDECEQYAIDHWAHYLFTRAHIAELEAGKFAGANGRGFGPRVAQAVDAVEGIPSSASAAGLADSWRRIAFLELVKCSPPWRLSTPTVGMREQCPTYLFWHEIQILQPAVVMIFGRNRETWQSVRASCRSADLNFRFGDSIKGALEWDHFEVAGRECLLLFSNHPSSRRHWNKSLGSLREQPWR